MVASGVLKNGFTLVELLIAMTIMLTMLVLSGTAYQLYTDTWRRDLSRIDEAFQQFHYSDLLLDAMQAILPLSVSDKGLNAYYFLGREEGFTAVTYAPIYNIGYPAVIRVFREQNEIGSYRLVYEEASLQHTVLKDADQELPFSYRQIIADNLSDLSFSYYGWENLDVRVASQDEFNAQVSAAPRWYSEFDSLNRHLHPEQIKIAFGDFVLQFTIPDRSRVNALYAEENPA
ncbi:MAG TPA: prepilin-type N-terminal cleavage/methylation domain-containing protein [Rheinheimera sp.]|uniref:type II secretion system protein n=1 Tax=Rheinheimera sp. TaxID=1869214 RepID=UPI002F93A0D2